MYLPTALVGTSGFLLIIAMIVGRDQSWPRKMPTDLPEVRLYALYTGSGYAGYLVFFRTVAFCDHWDGLIKTEDLKYFYPTDVLVTGYDIIFFWVIRMIFSGYEQMGEKPFKTVLFHGLVRDCQGRKMSKSLGNGIDPLEVIDQYGADALRTDPDHRQRSRATICVSTDERVEDSSNFANKVWNASRFIMMNMENAQQNGSRADTA